jgi:hypothetical protein
VFDLEFASEQDAVDDYTTNFGPFVIARTVLVRRFNRGTGGTARIPSEYFLITVER